MDIGVGNKANSMIKNKWLVLSFLACFAVLFVETLGFNYSIGDHPYYTMGGRGTFGDGHDLTLLVTKPLSLLGNFALPLFFNLFLASSIYFLLKAFPRIKYPEWAFILAPITPLASVYAQLFAIALFNIGLGVFFRNRYKLFPVFLLLTFFAHFWSGLFLAGAIVLYVLLFDYGKEARRWCLLPTMIIISFFSYSFMARGLDFLSQISGALPAGGVSGMTILDFLGLLSRNGVFIVLACIGLVILYIQKYKKFLVLCAMLILIPMITMFMFSNSIYWNWRMAYFMPLTALTTVFMSWLHQR